MLPKVSASSAIRWLQRFHEDGTFEPMPRGGGTSPLEKYSQQILDLIGEQRDLTLNELVAILRSDVSLQAAAHCRVSSLAMASLSKKLSRTGSACGTTGRAGAG
jgi:transposase